MIIPTDCDKPEISSQSIIYIYVLSNGMTVLFSMEKTILLKYLKI